MLDCHASGPGSIHNICALTVFTTTYTLRTFENPHSFVTLQLLIACMSVKLSCILSSFALHLFFLWEVVLHDHGLSWVTSITLKTLVNFSADDKLKYLVVFFSFRKTGIDISCKLSPLETICMKCQILFPGENKKTITKLSSAELSQRVVKVKRFTLTRN